jgi:hypothetical protein
MDLDTMLTEAAPARHLPLDGPDSPAAVRLYQQITAEPPAAGRAPRRRRLARPALVGVAAAAVAAAVALALVPGSPAGHRGGQGGVALAAWSVVKERHGLIKVTIRQLRDPAGLEQTLRADGVPAHVRFVHRFFQASAAVHLPKGCLAPHLSGKAIAKLDEKLIPNVYVPNDEAVILRPSAIPHGIGLSLKAWAPKPGTRSAASLSMEIDPVQATPQCTG